MSTVQAAAALLRQRVPSHRRINNSQQPPPKSRHFPCQIPSMWYVITAWATVLVHRRSCHSLVPRVPHRSLIMRGIHRIGTWGGENCGGVFLFHRIA